MTLLWQIMPSMAFKLGVYDGVCTVGDVKRHGDFGTGQFAALDGELIVKGGEFYRARVDGSVTIARDDDTLCFAQLCHYEAEATFSIDQQQDQPAFEALLRSQFPSRNLFCAFQIDGRFAQIVPTAPPAVSKPYPPFTEAIKLRKAFPASNIDGTIVGFFSPAFTASFGIPGFHYHFVSDDRSSAGHVTSFVVAQGRLSAARIRQTVLELPTTAEYANVVLN